MNLNFTITNSSCRSPERPSTPRKTKLRTKFASESGYQFDYEAQRTTWFSGLPGLWVQDAACQSGVAAIQDRTQENLCASDAGIVATRRLLLETLEAMRGGGAGPSIVNDPETYKVRAVSVRLPAEASWLDACRPFMEAEIGAEFGYTP